MILYIILFLLFFILSYLALGKNLPLLPFFLVFFIFLLYLLFLLEIYPVSTDLTYGSDARYYYDSVISSIKGYTNCENFHAPFYVCAMEHVLSLSPDTGHYHFVMFNLSLLLFSCMLVAYSLNKLYKLTLNEKLLIVFLLLNPIILWAGLRGLKEPLIMFGFSLIFYSLVKAETNKSFLYLFLPIVVVVFDFIKPLGGFFVLLSIFISYISFRYGFLKVFISCFLGYLLVTFAVSVLIDNNPLFYRFLAHRDNYESINQLVPSTLDYFTAPLRFILGPGPIRSLQQIMFGDVFVVSSVVGDFLIFFGSLFWWGGLFYLFICSINRGLSLSTLKFPIVFSIFFSMVYILSYSVIYLGTGDTRHRAIIYFTLAPSFVILCRRAFYACK